MSSRSSLKCLNYQVSNTLYLHQNFTHDCHSPCNTLYLLNMSSSSSKNLYFGNLSNGIFMFYIGKEKPMRFVRICLLLFECCCKNPSVIQVDQIMSLQGWLLNFKSKYLRTSGKFSTQTLHRTLVISRIRCEQYFKMGKLSLNSHSLNY